MTRGTLNVFLISFLWLSSQSARAVEKAQGEKPRGANQQVPKLLGEKTQSQQKVPVWELEQFISNWGTQNFLVASDAVKIEDRGRGYVMVCKAPDWKVIYYAPTRKKIAFSSFDKFDGGLARRLAVVMATFSGCENPSKVQGWIRNGTEKYLGRVCQKWVIRPDIATKRELGRWQMLNSNEIKAAPQIVSFLSSQLCLPNHGTVCLYYQNGHSVTRPVIRTSKMKKTLVLKTEFDPPKDFEKSTPEKVMFTNQDFEL